MTNQTDGMRTYKHLATTYIRTRRQPASHTDTQTTPEGKTGSGHDVWQKWPKFALHDEEDDVSSTGQDSLEETTRYENLHHHENENENNNDKNQKRKRLKPACNHGQDRRRNTVVHHQGDY